MRGKLTKKAVEALRPGEALFDTELPGFHARARAAETTYCVKFIVAGRQRRVTLGKHGAITAEEARKLAKGVLGEVAHGRDPAAEKARARSAGSTSFREVADLYITEWAVERGKRPRSIEEDARLLKLHLTPALGALALAAVGAGDLYRLRTRMRTTPVAFNRSMALLSTIFGIAAKRGLVEPGHNPAKLVERFPERRRERLVTAEEYARLWAALDASEGTAHPSFLAAVRLLMVTGARLSEVLTLEWRHVDFEHAALRLPVSKTGAKSIPLAAPALAILAGLPQISRFVLPGANLDDHYKAVQEPWRKLRAKAGLPDLRLHDLRHGFASIGAASGESLKILGGVLGHRHVSTTERYAHLSADPLRATAERIAGKIAATRTHNPASSLNCQERSISMSAQKLSASSE